MDSAAQREQAGWMNLQRAFCVGCFAVCFGCANDESPAADLPEGWAGAERIEQFVQNACGGSAIDDHDERAEVAASTGGVQIDYHDAHFRCAQDVEGFVRRKDGKVDLLVQPLDMSPDGVAACDCLYHIEMEVAPLTQGETAVRVYRRWDNLNDANAPVLIQTTNVAER